MVGAIGGWVDLDRPRRRTVVDAIEEQQLDPGGMLGKHAEIHAAAARRGPERPAASWFWAKRHVRLRRQRCGV